MKFQIVNIDSWTRVAIEPAGAKEKSWYAQKNGSDEDQTLFLFKVSKNGTGEHWSEVVAFKLAEKLGLPCAEYQFATLNGQLGVISRKINPRASELIEGVDLISEDVPNYTDSSYFKRTGHTLDRVFSILKNRKVGLPINFEPQHEIKNATDVFTGYLLLDALIGNADRHDQNWAVIRLPAEILGRPAGLYLSPTYDHGASLGREITDEKKQTKLQTKDAQQSVTAYAEKCRSAFYRSDSDTRTMSSLEVFSNSRLFSPDGAQYWLRKLSEIQKEDVDEILDALPEETVSKQSVDFCREIVHINKNRLLTIQCSNEDRNF